MQKVLAVTFFTALFLFLLGGCEKITDPATVYDNPILEKKGSMGSGTVPGELVAVEDVTFWPYTGTDFSGTPADPMSLFFSGEADPRAIRAALLFLDGNRTVYGFPDVFPFNVTWRDAIGGVQTSYTSSSGWIGSAIQLEAGDYQSLRFHLRLFDAGEVTLGGVHLDLLIPNTTEHQVISWEVPEQLITVDMMRSGLLDMSISPYPAPINPEPSFREIPESIWSGMPDDLKFIATGFLPPPYPSGNFPLPCDGNATVFHLATSIAGSPQIATQDFVIDFDQVIPKPFCASSPYDLLYVQGPVHLRQKVVLTPSGNFISQFHANGHLNLTPLDFSYSPVGNSYKAVVNEHHKGIITNNVTLVSNFQMQVEIPPTGPFRGQLLINLNVGPGNSSNYSMEVKCDNP